MPDELEELRIWFRSLGASVAAVDFERARPLFSPGVVSFGTHEMFVSGLDNLERDQWRNVWPKISDFEFLVDQIVGSIDGGTAWAAVPWTSTGYHDTGAPFDRPGRATVTYHRVAGAWCATHTHFSLKPGTPPRTYGPRSPPAG